MRPERTRLAGTHVNLEPLDPAAHGDALWAAIEGPSIPSLWDYMPYGPFPDRESFDDHLRARAATSDPLFFAILNRRSGLATGCASLMRIDEPNRVVEIGGILFSPLLQRTRGATESMYLFARHVFEDLGYRRYEWKCNALNQASRAAALRLGFTFEGIFRQHMLVKGRNRDTAWFSMLDSEWPSRKEAFERWLSDSNFDVTGTQIKPLARS